MMTRLTPNFQMGWNHLENIGRFPDGIGAARNLKKKTHTHTYVYIYMNYTELWGKISKYIP